MDKRFPPRGGLRAFRRNSSGSLLLVSMLVLFLMMILLPAVVRMATDDSRWSVRRAHMDGLTVVAEGGLNRGAWKLAESDTVWTTARAGGVVTQYNYDKVFTDLDPNYEYKMKFFPGPQTDEVTVQCKARSIKNTSFVRTVEAVYARGFADALVLKQDMDPTSDKFPLVHWAPIKSFTSLNNPGGAPIFGTLPEFPRKFAAKGIGTRDVTADDVNTDRQEYWAYDKGLTTFPNVDIDYYRTKAKGSALPANTGGGGRLRRLDDAMLTLADPPGSGYFNCSDNVDSTPEKGIRLTASFGGNYQFVNSTTVVFLEDLDSTDCQMVLDPLVYVQAEALVVSGVGGRIKYKASYDPSENTTIPTSANLEYQTPTAVAFWNSGMSAVWSLPGRCCFNVTGHIGFRGFMYVSDGEVSVESATPIQMIGALCAKTLKTSLGSNDFQIYYDEAVGQNVKLLSEPLRRRSFRERRSDTTW